VLFEHGPNASAGPNGQNVLTLPTASAEFAAQSRRSNPGLITRRHRGGYSNGAPHILTFCSNPGQNDSSWRVDLAEATTSRSSTAGTMSGDYSDYVYLGCRLGGAFAASGPLSFFALLDDNVAATRVVEYQAALDYGLI